MSNQQPSQALIGCDRIAMQKTFLRIISILAWPFIVLAIFIYGMVLGDILREYAFVNVCPAAAAHPSDLANTRNYADWCDVTWWHPFRLSTRILLGVVAGSCVALCTRFLLPQNPNSYRTATVFLYIMIILALLLSVEEASYRQTGMFMCGMGQHDKMPLVDCMQQFGPYGDQRFYYPITVLLSCIAWFWHRLDDPDDVDDGLKTKKGLQS
ncbi:MAG: hypothetical protein NT123_06840 [Proteobacteria bacterium]|nr:hypothetical protein [Pseudomonadota bacterium]